MGYKFQFITLAGFHSLNYSMFNLAHGYARNNMSAFVELQEAEFAAADKGFTAVKHQREVGTGYFDAVTTTVQGSQSSTTALKHSTEDEQFFDKPRRLLTVLTAGLDGAGARGAPALSLYSPCNAKAGEPLRFARSERNDRAIRHVPAGRSRARRPRRG